MKVLIAIDSPCSQRVLTKLPRDLGLSTQTFLY
jgi:hypothetical protein